MLNNDCEVVLGANFSRVTGARVTVIASCAPSCAVLPNLADVLLVWRTSHYTPLVADVGGGWGIYRHCGGHRRKDKFKHIVMPPLNYDEQHLLKRTRAHGDVVVGSNLVSGIVTERALKLVFAPIQGSLPKTLARQGASDHKVVRIDKLIVNGSRPHAEDVQVPEADAAKGIRYARRCVEELRNKLNLNMLCADHYNCELPGLTHGRFSHDLLCQEHGCSLLDSVEIKIREVVHRRPKTFNWQKVLESEAETLWNAELDWDPDPWRRRVLVFVEIIPGSGEVRGVHISALEKNRKKWHTVSGWTDFWTRDDGDAPDPEPPVQIARSVGASAEFPSTVQVLSLNKKLRAQGVYDEDDDSWVALASFMRAVGKSNEVSQAKRYISNKKGKRWLRRDGGRPRNKMEYKYKKGIHGGGTGNGILHGRLSWLRFVYSEYCC